MIEFTVEEEKSPRTIGACIKVIGVGGGGSNAVNSMAQSSEMETVGFIITNTDAQALHISEIENKVQIGEKITKGLGAGSNPDVGRRAAEEDIEVVVKYLEGADILFLTAGMGGGTGSGALPVIAQVARDMGILSVAIVTKPFLFEGKRRMRHAEDAIKQVRQSVDTLLVVPNQKLLETVDPKISMLDAFAFSNDVLKQAIKGISDIITKPGHINVDFADVRSIMKDMGLALMGVGRAEGEDRAREAALRAISSPLLEDVSIDGARGVLINITGNTDLGLHEINDAAEVVYDLVSEDANIILGSVVDTDMGNEIMVTVIATGFEHGLDKDQAHGHLGAYVQSARRDEHEGMHVAQTEHTAPAEEAPAAEEEAVQSQTTSSLHSSERAFDMHDLDTPAFLRKRAAERDESSE